LALAPDVARGGAPRLDDVDVKEALGASLPLELPLVDETGRAVTLARYFTGDKPVVLVLAYFRCPMLCGLVLNGARRAIATLGLVPEKDFRVVTVSFDPRDSPHEAAAKQRALLGDPPEFAWPFLSTPDARVIERLAERLGFEAKPIAETGELAHPAVLFLLTPDGRISRYLYGIDFPARELRLALLEAGEGKIGTTLERMILRCYRYDPATRRYGLYVEGMLRGGGAVVLGVLAFALTRLWRRERSAGRA
jgi:protein SCO1